MSDQPSAGGGGLPQRSGRCGKRPRARTVETDVAKSAKHIGLSCETAEEESLREGHKQGSPREALAVVRYAPNDGYDPAFEYLDHTADVQLHAWGQSLPGAFGWAALAMLNYMTPLSGVSECEEREVKAEGHDLNALLYNFLDEWLFAFSADFFVARSIRVVELDRSACRVRSVGSGEKFSLGKHQQGTEVKAITHSNMQIHERADNSEIFVIVDI